MSEGRGKRRTAGPYRIERDSCMAKAKPAKAQVPVMSAKKKGWGYDLKKNWPCM